MDPRAPLQVVQLLRQDQETLRADSLLPSGRGQSYLPPYWGGRLRGAGCSGELEAYGRRHQKGRICGRSFASWVPL